jgi:hypothetical protein
MFVLQVKPVQEFHALLKRRNDLWVGGGVGIGT